MQSIQQPLKDAYRADASTALVTLRADGDIDSEGIRCSVATGQAMVAAGLHPASGGNGMLACSGDLLLQALVACAGVTLRAVATSLEVDVLSGSVHAEGDLDFRGTMAVSNEAPVGFSDIRLRFDLDTDASEDQLASLLKLTQRYCVVLQTLLQSPQVDVTLNGPS